MTGGDGAPAACLKRWGGSVPRVGAAYPPGTLLPQTESRQVEVEGVLGRQKEVIRQTLTKRDALLR